MQLDLGLLYEIGLAFDHRPAPYRLFLSPAARRLCAGLWAAVATGQPVVLLTGEVGSGKTSLAHKALQALPGRCHVARLTCTSLGGTQVLRSIAYALGMPASAEQAAADQIEHCLRARRALGEASLLIVDDAHGLPPELLPTLLSLGRIDGAALLQILLIGAPGLEARLLALAGFAADAACFRLPGFSEAETRAYVHDRLSRCPNAALPGFTSPALAELHARSQGLPGRINVLCRQVLHGAVLLEDRVPIDGATIAAQAEELSFHPAAPARGVHAGGEWGDRPPQRPKAGLVLASMAVVALVLALQQSRVPVAPAVDPPLARLAMAPMSPEPTAMAEALALPAAMADLQFADGTPPDAGRRHSPARGFARSPVAAAGPLPTLLAGGREACSALLMQLSLGEPLTTPQRQLLGASCR